MSEVIEPIKQKQKLPGLESKMKPLPKDEDPNYKGSSKLKDKVAIITGADSGIGRAVAIAFAKEGADIIASYLSEDSDAKQTKQRVEAFGRKCILIPGDISNSQHCQAIVERAMREFGKIDILVNHAGEQDQTNSLDDVTDEKLERIFRVNVFSQFYLTRAALKYMKEGASIINTTSIVAYEGNPMLLDYTATKSANLGFTRALSQALAKKGIRVNAVAPGPIWTPLIPASFSADKMPEFGKQTPMQRPGQPYELAPAYVYLASNIDSSYVSGQVLHVNGGTVINA
ncbi:MAG: dehydrogenase, short-chain alcohol dehydrogenase like protein [Gammaproteobacteria bacterium]|jgi:NAD(P)-dependent dehydrogenase (short-subunit alcohol dehydrogenase family)|nr:dehydrogenase, short-chain alcohol dehydrogenase like protein [Gammaproteobacteria bacterium]